MKQGVLAAQCNDVEDWGKAGSLDLNPSRIFDKAHLGIGGIELKMHTLGHVIGEPVQSVVHSKISHEINDKGQAANDELGRKSGLGFESVIEAQAAKEQHNHDSDAHSEHARDDDVDVNVDDAPGIQTRKPFHMGELYSLEMHFGDKSPRQKQSKGTSRQ